MQPIKAYLRHPARIGNSIVMKLGKHLPDEVYLQLLFRFRLGYRLNLKHPKSYNEKLNWMKLYDRRDEYVTMVDKFAVKDYVASIIGKEYIIPTIGVWNSPEDIDWDSLPDKFVLKTTHGGGSNGVIICHDRASLDKTSVINKLNHSLSYDMFSLFREWPYKKVIRRIIAEQLIENPQDEETGLTDYKFFCFNGKVKALFVATERQKAGTDVKFDFFDEEYNHLPFTQGHDNAKVIPAKPKSFEIMKEVAEKLSRGYPQMRVDLYEVDSKVYFGEITLFHFGGMTPFVPREWDYFFGDWLQLL